MSFEEADHIALLNDLLSQSDESMAVIAADVDSSMPGQDHPMWASRTRSKSRANKRQESILDRAMAARGWDPADDPGNAAIKYPKPKAEPICYCPVLPKNQIGGMDPRIDLKKRRIVCRVCGKTIPKSCGRASVRHLRGLLNAKPEHVDFDSIRDLLL